MSTTLGTLGTLGKRIKQIRESSNISQSELAEQLKYLNQTQISKIENGGRKVTAEDLIEIARALNVSINKLIPEEERI